MKSGRILSSVIFCFLLSLQFPLNADPLVKKGILELPSTTIQTKIVPLDGEWQFFWKQFLEPGLSESEISALESSMIDVPGIWNDTNQAGEVIDGMGFATYRILVKSDTTMKVGIKIPDFATAYNVYWNGELIANAGELGKDYDSHKPQYYLSLNQVILLEGNNELLIQISNYSHYKGGVWEKIRFGEWSEIRQSYLLDISSELFLAGAILIMAIYHFGIFFLRKTEHTALYFALFCLSITIRILTVGERFLLVLFPEIPWGLGMQLEYASYYFSPIFFLMFVRSVYPDYISNLLIKISIAFTTIYLLIIIVLPATIYPLINTYFHIGTIFMILQGCFAVVRALIAKQDGSIAFTLGFIPIVVATINDILFSMLVVQTFQMISIGLFLFIFSQSFLLSMKFSRAFRDVEVFSRRLLSLDKMKDEFLANTSHELRTPLNGIIGIGESMIDGATGTVSPEQNQNLSMIVASAKRLANLVNDILDFSKMKNRDLVLKSKPTHISSIVNLVLAISRPMFHSKNLKITVDIPADLPLIVGDEERIQQILYNIIGNSIKFTEKGFISIKAEEDNKFIKVSISDSGIGIPAEKLDDVFLSFEQVDSSTSRTFGGTGLGLAITKKLVELHGGVIWATSKLGEGSVFYFTLPIYFGDVSQKTPGPELTSKLFESMQEEESSGSMQISNEPIKFNQKSQSQIFPFVEHGLSSEIPKGSFTILIVDDEPINRQVLFNHLRLENYVIKEASGGKEALDLIQTDGPPDMIILDVMMPVMSGYEVCSAIRKSYSIQQLPILILTAKTQIQDIVTGLEAGANDYLSKPFDKRELITRVRNLLILKKAVQEQSRYLAFQNEMLVARNLQTSILPEIAPTHLGIEVAFDYSPMEEVGGDFFDFHAFADGRVGVIIADVSGHGVPAALVAAMLKIASSLEFERSMNPSALLTSINGTLHGKTKKAFITASAIEIDFRTKALLHSRAGHPPLLILNKSTQEIIESLPKGRMIGWMTNPEFAVETIPLIGSHRIALYTDGIIEARDPSGNLYTTERFIQILISTQHLTPAAAIKSINDDIFQWTKSEKREDDITLILIDTDL
ncbi:SpoIIE family protein phosphatase [Leptospira sp. GIMC2001]|uniref:SpoIIE family protein phosphatase n=1 Tax=Leptospira sp. GIMC2001 TaxID=1513297 RepID=UPI00234BCA3D|nr:SpoIIE family protein phosphatase [Leptospira sp. GIMC2001]WCL49838.1 SpoIIE family protein phosphatase [Leptospira sp. GIMC2001]